VKVKNGVVRLTGTVPTGTRRLEAAVLARSIQAPIQTICASRRLGPHKAAPHRNTNRDDRTCGHLGATRERQWAESRTKGRLKEAAGVLTDDDRPGERGSWIKWWGKVKETAERAVDTVKDALTRNGSRRPAK
jgi:uncharacterized protein YjbJ (UPF0337 family)